MLLWANYGMNNQDIAESQSATLRIIVEDTERSWRHDEISKKIVRMI